MSLHRPALVYAAFLPRSAADDGASALHLLPRARFNNSPPSASFTMRPASIASPITNSIGATIIRGAMRAVVPGLDPSGEQEPAQHRRD
jgi:hypothetical protein